jgi:hypothetical protein
MLGSTADREQLERGVRGIVVADRRRNGFRIVTTES